MSKAEPMALDRRLLNYLRPLGATEDSLHVYFGEGHLTSPQRRRAWHKAYRSGERRGPRGAWNSKGRKSRPTPRRRKRASHG